MVEAIMSTLSSVVESFGGVLGKVFTGISSIFYVNETGQLTFLGVILMIGVGASLVHWGFKLIQSLLAIVGSKK